MNQPRSFRRVVTLLLVVCLLFPSTAPGSRARAQGAPEISVTGAYLTCGDAGGFGFTYSANRQLSLVVTVLSGDVVLQAGDPFVGQAGTFAVQWPNQGSLGIEVVAYELDDTTSESPILAYSDVITCVMEPDPPDDPDPSPPSISVSGAYLTCGTAGGFGFTYSANREFRFVVAVLDGDSYLLAGDPFVGQSGNFYFPWPNEGSVDIEVIAYELTDTDSENPILGFSGVLTCVMEPDPPGETPTSEPSPTPTQTLEPTQTPQSQPTATETPVPTQTPQPEPTPTPVVVSIDFEVPDPSDGVWLSPTNAPEPTPTPAPPTETRVADARIAYQNGQRYVQFTMEYKDSFEKMTFSVLVSPTGPIVLPSWMGGVASQIWSILYPAGNILIIEKEPEPTPVPTVPVEREESSDGGPRCVIRLYIDNWDADYDIWDIVIYGRSASQFGTGVVQRGSISADGEFVLDDLPDGRYQLSLTSVGMQPVSLPFVYMGNHGINYSLSDDGSGGYILAHEFDSPEELHHFMVAIEPATGVTSLPDTGAGFDRNLPLAMVGLFVLGILGVVLTIIRAPARRR